jgi:hypothetical protein
MTGRRLAAAAVAGLGAVVAASPLAYAQTTPAVRTGRVQIAVTGSLATPRGFDPAAVVFLTPGGEALVVSESQARAGLGVGLDVHFGIQLSPSIDVEATGSWLRTPYSAEVTFDLEDAVPVTARVTASQFVVEGAVLFTVARRGQTDFFVRGAGGWLFESSDQFLIDNGWTAQAGGGVKYWWRGRSPSAARLGLRLEGRLRLHDTRILASGRDIRLTPVLAGGVIIGL